MADEGPWKKQTDAEGRVYYFNPLSNQSRWDHPGSDSSQWQRLTDDATGKTYYHNPSTGETRWDAPQPMQDPTLPSAPPLGAKPPSSPSPEAQPGTVDESKALGNRAARRASMLPSSTKASMRRSVLQAANRVREASESGDDAAANTGDDAAANTGTSGSKVSASIAARLGRWRYRGKGQHISGLKLDNGKGVPVRETLQAMYKINRDKTLKEACLFFVWSALFVSIVYAVNDVHLTYATNDALIDLFLDEEFADANYKKNFYEIYTMGEYWTFLQGPVFNGLYANEWYNEDPFNKNQTGYVLHNLRFVGGVQLRQARVSSESCQERRFLDDCITNAAGVCVPRFDSKDGSCYAEFTIGREDTAPFGPPEDPTRYTWADDYTELQGLYNFGPDYGHGGYVTVLPLDRDHALGNLTQLYTDLWTDRGTRMVLVSFNLYNTNTKLMSTVRILIEFFSSGHLVRSFKFFTIKLVVYQSKIDTLRMIGEFVFIGFFVYYLQKELRTMLYHRPFFMYFTKFRNVFEVTFLGFILAVMVAWIRYITDPLKANFTVNTTEFVDMYPLAEKYMAVYTLAGFIGLGACLKVFKFLAISKKMNALWLTLFRAAPDLLAFILGFVVLVAGFAFMASMLFGFQLVDFHNFLASFSTLLRFPLGDFDYDALQIARPAITGIFFTFYVGMVFLVCMNMIIGIVTKYFDEVHHELKYSDKWKISTMSLEAHLMQRTNRTMRRWGTALKRCVRRNCRKGTRPTEGDLQAEAEEKRQTWSDKVQADGWVREAAFLQELHRVMRQAKRQRNIDLYSYIDRVYTNAPANTNVYVGVHELCHLSEKSPCAPSQHFKCAARRMIDAYNNIKAVTIVGSAVRHQPQASVVVSKDFVKYPVIKVNRSGIKQKRLLVVDSTNSCILNFSPKMALKKTLPLTQLIQLDSSRTDQSRLCLVFTSQGMPFRSMFGRPDDFETQYDLVFESKEARDAFVGEVSAAKNKMRGSPLGIETANPMLSRRQLRTEQSVLGAGGPRDAPGLAAGAPAADSKADRGDSAAAAAGSAAAAVAAMAHAPAPAAASDNRSVSSSQLGVIVEHMRSQRAALRIVMEQLHALRTDVQRIAP